MSVVLVLAACPDPEDLAQCEFEPATDDVIIEITSGDLTAVPASGAVQITGIANAKWQLDRLLVGPVRAGSSSQNFGDWSVSVPLAVLHALRDGEFATLPVTAVDVCENVYEVQPVCVRVNAPAATGAACLEVEVKATREGECYLPADGSSPAEVRVRGSADAAGVVVKLSAAVEGEFLGATNNEISLRSIDVDAQCGDTGTEGMGSSCDGAEEIVHFRANAAGLMNIAVSAGPTFAIDVASELRAVEAPKFAGASGALTKGQLHVGQVYSDGRLQQCRLSTTTNEVIVEMDGAAWSDPIVDFDDPACGQAVTFNITFGTEAPSGATVVLECEDTYGQASQLILSAAS